MADLKVLIDDFREKQQRSSTFFLLFYIVLSLSLSLFDEQVYLKVAEEERKGKGNKKKKK